MLCSAAIRHIIPVTSPTLTYQPPDFYGCDLYRWADRLAAHAHYQGLGDDLLYSIFCCINDLLILKAARLGTQRSAGCWDGGETVPQRLRHAHTSTVSLAAFTDVPWTAMVTPALPTLPFRYLL